MNTSTEYMKGRVAYAMGEAYTDCPYILGTDAWMNWSNGWLDAECAYHIFVQAERGPQ